MNDDTQRFEPDQGRSDYPGHQAPQDHRPPHDGQFQPGGPYQQGYQYQPGQPYQPYQGVAAGPRPAKRKPGTAAIAALSAAAIFAVGALGGGSVGALATHYADRHAGISALAGGSSRSGINHENTLGQLGQLGQLGNGGMTLVPGLGNGSSGLGQLGNGSGGLGQGGQDQSGQSQQQAGTKVTTPGVLLVSVQGQGFEGAGTGLILDANGLAVTNYHVVENTTQVQVTDVSTGKVYTATVLGHDQAHDVAVLQIQGASGLTPIGLDAGAAVTQGEKITAVGNGSGQGYLTSLDGTVTATNQAVTAQGDSAAPEHLTGLIETDADVVPGYSGGPMLDSQGKAIGMLAAASEGGNQPVTGYAIPIGTVQTIVGEVTSGQGGQGVVLGPNAALGVEVGGNAAGQALGGGKGVVVSGVQAGGPAAGAGIAQGDTITAINGQPVANADQLQAAIRALKVGAQVSVQWLTTGGQTQQANVTLAASPVN